MRWVLITIAAVLAGGCAPYAQVQQDLLVQVRRGVALGAEYEASLAAQSDELAALRRQRLDEAFDADVRQRAAAPDAEGLSAQWVIDHRVAYALALDAYAAERADAQRAREHAERNRQAINAALRQLETLASLPSRLFTLEAQP